MECGSSGSTRWFYTGNQPGYLNHTGLMNFVSGGIPGSGIDASTIVPRNFPPPISRAPWEAQGAVLDQKLLDGSFPYIGLNWIADIELGDATFRISDKNVYVEEKNGPPRFYEARGVKGPSINITNGEWLAPNFEIGDVSLMLNNRDGFFNDYLPNGSKASQWMSAKVTIRVGFGEKFENYFEVFFGYVAAKQGVTVTDDTVTLKIYDRFDKDEVPLPVLFFNEINYPLIQDDMNGKGIPLVYGDWSTEVGNYGEIPAYCINALEDNAAEYVFKISQNSLSSIGEVYLSRGSRNFDAVDGPIRVLDAAMTKDAATGTISIASGGVTALAEYSTVMEKTQSGSGSGVNLITSDTPGTNFIEKGVKAGDLVLKTSTSEQAIVQTVTNNQITLTGGVTFPAGTEYGIRTLNYAYKKGDKITLKCVGKNLSQISTNRLSDAGLGDAIPVGLTVDLEGNYWFADDSKAKVFKVSFTNEVLLEIPYASIDPSISVISGITVQTDNTFWVFEKLQSKIYRYDLAAMAPGMSFTTAQVSGIGTLLTGGAGITIDTGNFLYLVDNTTGNFYVINPFAPLQPTKIYQWNRTAFDALATDTWDLSADVNLNQLCLVDRNTQKFYRINQTTGAPISSMLLSEVSAAANFVVGVSVAQDGTVFFLNRSDNSLYNYNEFANAKYNPGFIARDIIQSLTGKTSNDFDLAWNQTSRTDLAGFRGRLYIQEKTSVIAAVNKFLQQFNTVMFANFGKYSLWMIDFDNFRTDGMVIREGDIQMNTFKASKEYNQYFNSVYGDYQKQPFSGAVKRSDTYISPSGQSFAGAELVKKIDMPNIYRREDVDILYPLFVRLAAAEPEFLSLTTPFRFLFTQLTKFFMINYTEMPDPVTGLKKGGRRFDNVPAFSRQITYNLDSMTIALKLWSLGSTQFDGYTPDGPYAGGELDKIVLTNLGTVGYIAPVGTITGSGADYVDLEDVLGVNAQNRSATVVGLAWTPGYRVAFIDAATMATAGYATILSVSGARVTFDAPIGFAVPNSVKNASGFMSSGYFLRYAEYGEATALQKSNYAFFGPPLSAYPTNSAIETDEQRAGMHNLPDNRMPYIFFPKDFVPG